MRSYVWLALAALVAFGDALRGSFHFDDYALLSGPPAVLFETRPLTALTFWINYKLGGGYHLVNLLLHVAVACLLFDVLRRLIPERAALIGAALFAVHPLQSEAVAYIFARGTLLSTLFCLLTFRAVTAKERSLAVLYFALALLCTQECVTFPVVLLLLTPRDWKTTGAMLALSFAAGLRTVLATQAIAGAGAGFAAGIAPLDYLAQQAIVILRYLRLLIIPWGFTIDPAIKTTPVYDALAWLILIAAIAYAVKRRYTWVLAGFILLLPSSSIFPAADLSADRRMYLPMIAFSAALGLWAQSWKPAVPLLAGIAFTVLSIGRMQVWRTEESLWREAVARAPDKLRPRLQLARAVPPAEALGVLKDAPDSADVATERGRIWLELGQPANALGEFGRALALRPRDAHAINNRGVALMALGQNAAARKDFERALSIDPKLPDAIQNLQRLTATEK